MIIYDTTYGNTKEIAEAIGEAMNVPAARIQSVKDLEMPDLKELEVLVVGSPTYGFSPSQPIRNFLRKLPPDSLGGIKIAAFDTRADITDINNKFLRFLMKMFGYAAKPIQAKLIRKGGTPAGEPMGFMVKDKEGPLKEGELTRAKKWVEELG